MPRRYIYTALEEPQVPQHAVRLEKLDLFDFLLLPARGQHSGSAFIGPGIPLDSNTQRRWRVKAQT
eukprot:2257039-Prymnesium_polylepis.2